MGDITIKVNRDFKSFFLFALHIPILHIPHPSSNSIYVCFYMAQAKPDWAPVACTLPKLTYLCLIF